MKYLTTALIFFFMGLAIPRNNVRVTEIATDEKPRMAEGTEPPYFFMTVGDKIDCYLGGDWKSVKDYQKGLCLTGDDLDGIAGTVTMNRTCFMNGQDEMMGYNK